MADTKTSALTAITTPLKSYVLPMLDNVGALLKKIDLSTFFANGSWVIPAYEGAFIQSDFTLAAAAGVQAAFPTTNDVFTVAANTTYRFRGQYILNTGATTHTTALAFALTTATVSSFEYFCWNWSAALNAIATASNSIHISGVASKVINATGVNVYTLISFEGVFRTGTGGTITPQINFSANPTGTNLMKVGSFIEFWPIGANTVAAVGGWA